MGLERIFVLLALWFFWLPAAWAHKPSTVPVAGTDWLLVEPEAWSAREQELFVELASALPDEYRFPGHPVFFHLDDIGHMPDDEPHVIARLNRRHDITLYTRGLAGELQRRALGLGLTDDPGGARTAAEYLLQRSVVHELTHLVDRRLGLSRSQLWRGLGGWSLLSWFPSPADRAGSGDFASPYGARSPREDLATFAEVYFLPPTLGPVEADDHPRCHFPSKYRFFNENLGPHPDPAPNVRCATAEEMGLGAADVSSVEILWATPTLSSLASVAGHLLLAVEADGERNTYAMLADSTGVSGESLMYVIYGLAGGFYSKVVQVPYPAAASRYRETEDRDLLHFRWELTEEDENHLLTRLDELRFYWKRPYFFFWRNCSQLIIELAASSEAQPLSIPLVTPPDLVLAQMARKGRVAYIPPRSRHELAPTTTALLLQPERRAALGHICGASFRDTRSANPAHRDGAYGRMLEHVQSIDEPSCWLAMAHALALSVPLEQSARLRAHTQGEPIQMASYEKAQLATRQQVPFEQRQTLDAELDEQVLSAFAAQMPQGAASQSTPYVPLTIGAGLQLDAADKPLPALIFRRQAIDLVNGRPRLFSPARGMGIAFFDVQLGLGLDLDHSMFLRHHLLHFRYQPATLFRGPSMGAAIDLLQLEMDSHDAWASARWLEGGLLLNTVHSNDWRHHLDLAVGPALESVWAAGEHSLLAGMPVAIEAAAHGRDGRVRWTSRVAWVPAVIPGTGTASLLEHQASAGLFLGRIAGTAVELEANSTGRFPLGTPPAWLQSRWLTAVGFRLERY